MKVTYPQMAKAIKLVRAGKEIDYEGAFSPVDFDANGRHRLGRVRDLEVLGARARSTRSRPSPSEG